MATKTKRLGTVNGLEKSLIAATLMLVVIGVACVGSAAAPQMIAGSGSVWIFILRDLAFVAIGGLCFAIACRFPASRIGALAVPMLILSGGLLVAVRMFGTTVSGGRRWLSFDSLSIQPSAMFTLASCLYLAYAIARSERTSRNWIDLLKLAAPVLAGAILIFIEPDMGTASVIVIVTIGIFVLAGMPSRLVFSTIGVGAVAALGFAYSSPYRRQRLLSFLSPNSDQSGAGYQVLQSKIGLGAGRVTGLGFGHSREKWGLLPNPHTDFILAVIGEELGFIGSALVVGLFIWLISLGMRTASRAVDRESQLLAAGITLWFGVETLINVASVVGLWPVTGIPLPFISYGGTSLIINLVAMGLLVNVARRTSVHHVRAPVSDKVAPLRPRTIRPTMNASQRGATNDAHLMRDRRRRG